MLYDPNNQRFYFHHQSDESDEIVDSTNPEDLGLDTTLSPPEFMEFWQKLQYDREQQGWTQEQLAEQIGVYPETIVKWENGESFPDSTFQQKLANLFGWQTADDTEEQP